MSKSEATTDRALDFAKFMVEESDGLTGAALHAVLADRFGDLTREQMERGMAIGEEIIEAQAAEYQSEADAMRAELARRKAARAT